MTKVTIMKRQVINASFREITSIFPKMQIQGFDSKEILNSTYTSVSQGLVEPVPLHCGEIKWFYIYPRKISSAY